MGTTAAFELALAQILVVGGDKAGNLRRAERAIADAAVHGSRIVLLPEALDCGWTHPSSQTEAEAIPEGEPYRRLARSAAKNQVVVCAGLTERSGEQVFNSAVVIGPDGSMLGVHRKLNEVEAGLPFYSRGDRLSVVRTEWGTLGLMICADGFAKDQVLSRSLGYMGADLILSPCAWAVPADHDNAKDPYGQFWLENYRPPAREFGLWIAGASNVGLLAEGPWSGRKCIGCSLVVGPDGEEVVRGPYGVDAETILYVGVEPADRPARGV